MFYVNLIDGNVKLLASSYISVPTLKDLPNNNIK